MRSGLGKAIVLDLVMSLLMAIALATILGLAHITIMAALPLAIGGAFVGLLIMGSTFSISSLIGILMLMGIAAKNSILLVEYALEAIKGGMSRHEALMDAAHKRARPILMTTVAMGGVSQQSPTQAPALGGSQQIEC
eukprot:gene59461-biopygen42892